MKKIFIILSLFLMAHATYAKNIKVEAMSDFSTANPSETWRVKIVEEFIDDSGFVVEENSIIEGKITDVKSPKRLIKRLRKK